MPSNQLGFEINLFKPKYDLDGSEAKLLPIIGSAVIQ